jgi:hypothetical protein
MVLQTLAAMGSLHGYGIARRIEQVSGDNVLLNQGTIYAALPEGWDEQRRNADHDQLGTLITFIGIRKRLRVFTFPPQAGGKPCPLARMWVSLPLGFSSSSGAEFLSLTRGVSGGCPNFDF